MVSQSGDEPGTFRPAAGRATLGGMSGHINRVGVVGAGTMGNGIAQAFAQAGIAVTLVDASAAARERARATIDKSLAKLVEKGKLTAEQRAASLARITSS